MLDIVPTGLFFYFVVVEGSIDVHKKCEKYDSPP